PMRPTWMSVPIPLSNGSRRVINVNEEEYMKEFRNPETVHEPVGLYTHQVELSSSERMLIISGQVGMRQDGTMPEDPIEQLELIFENLLHNLHAANMEMKD